MSITIQKEEVQFPQKRQRDDTGRVFIWNGRIFRGIFSERESHVRSLFSTGFLNELTSKNSFPKTWVTDYRMDGFSLILEHERIWPVVYPQEWTFSMLRDAALLVCRIALVGKKHGFNMRDCHGLNVLFDGVSPKFTDLGSFIPDTCVGWRPYEEFLRFYNYPLHMWKHNSFIGKLTIFSGNLTSHEAYWKYQYPLLRSIGPEMLKRLVYLRLMPELLPSCPSSDFEQNIRSKRRMLYKLVTNGIIPTKSMNLEKIIKEIERMRQDKTESPWGSYHEKIKEKAERFDRVIEVINKLEGDVKTAVDLGGNQGKFSRLLIQKTSIERVVCVDQDENAIEEGYNQEKIVGTGGVTFTHYDFMGCIAKLRFMLPSERFRSDVAIALALTHHLILSQGYDIEEVFRNISAYTGKYVLIEFMPLGLWAAGQKPDVPAWYTRDWFRQSFAKFFDLLLEEKLRENNILFVGKVRLTP